MALTENGDGNGMIMPVAPMGYGYGGGFGNGFGFGGDGAWIILFLFAMLGMGNWGGMGFGGFGGGLGIDFPWLMNGQQGINANTNAGFNQAATASALSGLQNAVTSGFGDVQLGIAGVNQNICQTGAGITAAVTNGFAQAEIADNARQMANMQQAFNSQTAITGGLTNLSSQLAQCCCDNRLATQALNSTIISENCADREALNNGVRDIITSQVAGTQRILDKLCDQELQAERRENDQLRQQLNLANLSASQTAQTARLLADNAAQTQQIENYVRPQINPAYIVPNPYAYNFSPYGWNNGWNGCNSGCGCGNNGFNGSF